MVPLRVDVEYQTHIPTAFGSKDEVYSMYRVRVTELENKYKGVNIELDNF